MHLLKLKCDIVVLGGLVQRLVVDVVAVLRRVTLQIVAIGHHRAGGAQSRSRRTLATALQTLNKENIDQYNRIDTCNSNY